MEDDILCVEYITPISSIRGEDEEDTRLIKNMYKEAEGYLRSFKWCLDIKQVYYSDGVGGVVALFVFQVDIANEDGLKWLWVIVGDVPSMYMMVGSRNTPYAALSRYTKGLNEWAEAAQAGRITDSLMLIDASPTPNNIELAKLRVQLLREVVMPNIHGTP